MPLSAARCFSLQGTERNSALVLALELASQAEGRGLGARFAGLSSIALCGRAARHSRDRSRAPSFPNALGHLGRGRSFWGGICGGWGRILPLKFLSALIRTLDYPYCAALELQRSHQSRAYAQSGVPRVLWRFTMAAAGTRSLN